MTVQRWDRIAMPWIVVAALLPVIGAAAGQENGGNRTVGVVIGIACWLVFVVDLVVRRRLVPGYLATRAGRIDLIIVILTCPWYLFISSPFGALVTLARLARLFRIVWIAASGGKVKRLVQQLGMAGIYAGGLLIACSVVVKWVEPPSSGYTTYGDAFWWGFVTITTVGYGDLTPVTTVGRIAAICLMFGGVALLGVLAGTLASFFGVGGPDSSTGEEALKEDEEDVTSAVRRIKSELEDVLARLEHHTPESEAQTKSG